MTYPEFIDRVSSSMQERMGDAYKVSVSRVLKNNALCLDGLLIAASEETVTPTIYLNDYYDQYQNGASLEEILTSLEETYERCRCPVPFDLSHLRDFSRMKDQIYFKLINRESNQALLEDVPYLPFLDLAIVFYFTLEHAYLGSSTALIHKSHLLLWNISKEDLFALARENTKAQLGHQIRPMSEVLSELLCSSAGNPFSAPVAEDPDPDNPMYLLTTDSGLFGASCLLFSDVLQEFSDLSGDDFYILPSSIHELILLPRSGSPDEAALIDMVREINRTEVAQEDVLSDHIYRFSSHAAGPVMI